MVKTPSGRAAAVLLLALCLLPVGSAGGDYHVWVDDAGVTHFTNDPEKVPETHRSEERPALTTLWDDGVVGAPLITDRTGRGGEEGRTQRTLRTAVEDLQRGDEIRATRALEEILRREPNRPEAHFYMALLDGRRGRLVSAEAHLREFLASAGDELDPWRASALRRLEHLEDERRLMHTPAAQDLLLVDLEHEDFDLRADAALLEHDRAEFVRTVGRYLDDARSALGELVGAVPSEPTGVVLYGKAAYLKTHGHRFSFRTVGFYDGRIHVVSAAHPAGELRKLLFHEYTHALFREQAGSDRPFWLTEGLAELAERIAEGRNGLSRDERRRLRGALAQERWIDLETLAPGFGGLSHSEARVAYLVATAAADWIARRTTSEQRAELVSGLSEGRHVDELMRSILDIDTQGLDRALRTDLGGA